jgi:phage terminase large subunit-like protein
MQAKSDAEKYFEAVIDGRIIQCKKIIKLAKIILPQIKNGYKDWHFDRERALRPVQFIENYCRIPSGKLGVPFKLELFQKAIIEIAFGFVDAQGNRRFQEVLCILGRKNGKSSLLAALELYMLIADHEGAPQVYNVANSEAQAELTYNAAIRILRQSKKLQRYAHKRAEDIYCKQNLGYAKPLTSQTRNLDGLDVHFAVVDELSAIVNPDLYDLVKQGMSAREQPMLFIITTNGFVRNGIFDDRYDYASRWLDGKVDDDTFLPFIYELDDRDEWINENMWIKANPGLGTIKKIESLSNHVNQALQNPRFRPTVLVKDFNMPENASIAWLNFEEAINDKEFDLKAMGFRYGIVGFDAADSIDLNSACMLMMRPDDPQIYGLSMFWLPDDALREISDSGDRKSRDNVPYEQWIARGLVRTVEGNKVHRDVLINWLEELKSEYDIYTYAVGFDPWHMDDTTVRALENYVGKQRVVPVRQGAQTLSMPMKQLKADYGAKRIVNHNPVLEWCRMNVSIRVDVNGNIQPDKKQNNPANRIDGFMAELDAYVTLNNLLDEYQLVI